MIWVSLQSELPWQSNEAITFFFLCVFLCTRMLFLTYRLREYVSVIIVSIMAKFGQILWERFGNISKRSFKSNKNSEIACYPHNWLILKKKKDLYLLSAASSHSGLIPLNTAYKQSAVMAISSFNFTCGLIPIIITSHNLLSSLGSIIENEQRREDARLRGGSLIKPCAKVPRQNESRRQCKVSFMK